MLKFKIKISAILIFSIILTFLGKVQANEPSTAPILRIETGMHTGVIKRIGVDTAERFLVTASHDKTLRLWDLKTGNLLQTYRVPIGSGNEGKLYCGAISPDGEWVAGGGWTGYEWDNQLSIYLFNRSNGKLIKRLFGLKNVINHLDFSPDGKYLAASLGGANGIRIWNTQTWEQIFSDKDYGDRSYWCNFDSQNRLVTSSYDGYLRLYSPFSDEFSLIEKTSALGGSQPFAAIFSSDGENIAVGFSDSTKINVLNGNDLSFLYAPDTNGINNGSLSTVAWSHDGNRLYAGGKYNLGSGINPVIHWPQEGQGNYTKYQGSLNTIMDIRPLKDNKVVYGSYDPSFGVLDNKGNKIIEQKASIADYRGKIEESFLISYDGEVR